MPDITKFRWRIAHPNDIANDLADLYISQFGQQTGQVAPVVRAPKKRQEIWKEQRVMPRGVDREVVEALHRTHIGDDQDPENILQQAIRTALADGWGGSLMATDISDILFGTPAPILGEANLGVLKDDWVNVVVHGHEPTLSQMIVAASQTPEIIEYAKAAGAKGVSLSGICCTANEILMRQGVPAAGNFLQQELAITHRRGGSHGGGCAVHHAGPGWPGGEFPHQDHHHFPQSEDHRGDSY